MSTTAERLGSAGKPPERAVRGAGLRAAAFLAVAVAAAAGAGLLFRRHLDRSSAAAAVPTERVVVAKSEIPAGTALRAELLATVDWPRAHLPAGALHDAAQLEGRIALVSLAKGEAVLASKAAGSDAGQGLAALLPRSMRAVAVRVDDVVGVAGFIHPGDNVDVIVTMKPSEGTEVPPVSRVILQDVRVLSVGKELDRRERAPDKAVSATVATLMVSSPDSERLALASAKGQILLALRSRADAETVATQGAAPASLLGDAWRPAPPPPRPAPAAPAPPAPPPRRPTRYAGPVEPPRPVVVVEKPAPPPEEPRGRQVEILRGDRFETRRFQTPGGKP